MRIFTTTMLLALASIASAQSFKLPCYDVVAMKYNPAALPAPIPTPKVTAAGGFQVFVSLLPGGECSIPKFITVRVRYRTATGEARFRQDVAAVTKQRDGKANGALLADIGLDSTVQAVEVEPVPFVDTEAK